jgi:predicted SAM-dependent methyltransferase
MSGIKLHIGGQEVKAGWKILDPVARPEMDYVGTAQEDLSFLEDGACAEVYASHVGASGL